MSVDAMESTEILAATAAIPRHIRELFGEPPLLRTESREAYDTLWSALVVQFAPRGLWIMNQETALSSSGSSS
jgi:hypothetical protein